MAEDKKYKLIIGKNGEFYPVSTTGGSGGDTPTPKSKNFVYYKPTRKIADQTLLQYEGLKVKEPCVFFRVSGRNKVPVKGQKVKTVDWVETKYGNKYITKTKIENSTLEPGFYEAKDLIAKLFGTELDPNYISDFTHTSGSVEDSLALICFPKLLKYGQNHFCNKLYSYDFHINSSSTEDGDYLFNLMEEILPRNCMPYHKVIYSTQGRFSGHMGENELRVINTRFIVKFIEDFTINTSEVKSWSGNMADNYLEVQIAFIRDKKYVYSDGDTNMHMLIAVVNKRFK